MDFWNKVPFVRLLIPFIIGIIVEIIDFWDIRVFLPIFLITSLLFIVLAVSPRLKRFPIWNSFTSLSVALSLFAGGFSLSFFNRDINYPTHFAVQSYDKEMVFDGVIYQPPQEKKNSVKAFISITSVYIDGVSKPVQGNLLVYFQKTDNALDLYYGDRVVFTCLPQDIMPPDNPEQFDFKSYLRNNNVYHQSYLREGTWSLESRKNGNLIKQFAFDSRKSLLSTLKKHITDEKNFAIGSALILGYKDELDPEMLRTYSSAGAMHVLAVSGLHVGIIFIMLNFMLRFLDKKGRHGAYIKAVILILCLWSYAFITGLSPSVQRAATMFSFIVIGNATGRSTNIYNTLSASAFLLICLDPLIITKVGFQLSYLAVIGIVYLQPKIYALFYFKNWFLDKIWAISCVSFAAQLATFPLGLYYFHQFPNYFFISNLLVIPLSTMILYSGVLVLLFSSIGLGGYIDWLLNALLTLLNISVEFVENIPFSLMYGNFITTLEVLLLYVVVILILTWFYLRRKRILFGIISCTLILVLMSAKGRYDNASQNLLVVYKVPKLSVVNLMTGNDNYLISSKDFLNDDNQQLYYIKHFWYSRGFTEATEIEENSNLDSDQIAVYNGMVQFGQTSIFHLKQSEQLMKLDSCDVDYLIIGGKDYINIESLAAKVKASEVILDSSIPKRKSETLKRLLELKGYKVYSVAIEGAFVADLKKD